LCPHLFAVLFAAPAAARTSALARSRRLCTRILSTPLEGDEFTPAQIAELARYIQRTLPMLPGDDLNLFLSSKRATKALLTNVTA
jgi:hypothetical protein